MRKTIWYIVGGQLATISIPVVAQEPPAVAVPEAMEKSMEEADIAAVVSTWPDERQAIFEKWPDEAKAYFWTLPTERQDIFWRLNPSDKLALAAMDSPDRDATWEMIEQRVRAMPSQPEGKPDGPATNPEPEGR